MSERTKVVIAGTAIYFCFGIYPSWSVLAGGLISDLNWTIAQASLPLTIDMMIFGISLIVGGRINDHYGPGKGSLLGAIITASAFIMLAVFSNPEFTMNRYYIAAIFGLFSGFGSALIFSVVQPSIIKWYSKAQRGKLIGLIYMALQGGPLIWAFVIGIALNFYNIRTFLFAIGFLYLIVLVSMSRLIVIPDSEDEREAAAKTSLPVLTVLRQVVSNKLFIPVCLISVTGKFTMASLALHLNQIVEIEYLLSYGYFFVSLFAVFTIAGCALGGYWVDKKGEANMLKFAFAFSVIAMFLYIWAKSFESIMLIVLVCLATMIMGINQGAVNTSISILTVNTFGLRNFGFTFGIIFAIGNIFGPLGGLLFGWVADQTGSFIMFFVVGLLLSAVGCGLSIYVGGKKPLESQEELV